MVYRYVIIAVIAVGMIVTLVGCGSPPVATVDGVQITEKEFNDRLVQSFGQDMLRDMIDRELFRQAARERGVEVTDEELQEELEQAQAQFGSEEMFHQWLASRDLTVEDWEEHVKTAILTRKLALHDIEPSEEQLRAFYEEHRDRFREPAMAAYSEIVVSTEEDAHEVLTDLESEGTSFADLARQYSLAPSRDAGGERPEMPIVAIPVLEIQEAVETLPIGEVSDPIFAEGQWYIIRVRDRQDERQIEWEADRERILEAYQMANARNLQEILQEQIEQSRVNIVDPRFQALNEIYTPVPAEIPRFGIEEPQMPQPQAPIVDE